MLFLRLSGLPWRGVINDVEAMGFALDRFSMIFLG
jgi:hypothetical protein